MNIDTKKKNSVLIVDDARLNITVLSDILSQEYTVHVSTNGTQAISMAKKYLPDVILLDIVMRGLDGFEVVAALKDIPETRNIPVVFLTGLDNREDEEKGLTLGAADYISKPISPGIVKLRVGNQIKIVNQIRDITRLTMFDTLTEIPNRLSFNKRLGSDWGRAMRNGTPIGILMMDLDRFKLYNDTYGHLQGDTLLHHAAKSFTQTLRRASDFVARWGGEEFAVLLPDADRDRTLKVAEKIRAGIENMVVLSAGDTETRATISIGANSITPEIGSSIDTFITQADTALYSAKEQGRNRVCFYTEGS